VIPQAHIIEWQAHVPWKSPDMVEQDLVICRALVEIFNEPYLSENLAFRGGTALNKLYLNPQPRYSEDIDMVQVESKPIKETINRIQKQLAFLNLHQVRQRLNNNTVVFKYDSESNPVSVLKLKIEINCREHFSILGFRQKEFDVNSEWFKGSCLLKTYMPEELLGTKLRALYQRRKGRDLYDIYKAMTTIKVDTKDLISSYREYMKFSVTTSPSRKQFIHNIEEKITDDEFLGDTKALIRPDEKYDPIEAWNLVRTQIIEMI
jgi:predicted nucleotidyltransferase component of viral defense system